MHNNGSTSMRLWTVALMMVTAATAWAGAKDDLADKLRPMKPEKQLEYLRGEGAKDADAAVIDFHIGNAFFSLDNLDSALVYYGRATGADSSYGKAWVNMGLVYDGQHQTAAARRCFNAALKINPDDVLALCHLGFSYFAGGDKSRAMELYERALSVDPQSAQAHYNLGLAFADAKIFREALLEWQKVMEIDPTSELGKTAAENVKLIKTYMELDQ